MPKINEFKCAVWLTLAPPVIFFCLTFFPDFRNFLEVLIGTSNTKIPLFNLLFLLLVMLITGLFLWLKMIGFYLFRKITKKQMTKQPYDSCD